MSISDGNSGVLLPLFLLPLCGCPVCGSWLWDAHPFITGFVLFKPNPMKLEAGLREPAEALERVQKRPICSSRQTLPPTSPSHLDSGAAGAAAAAGACMDHHRGVLQCPQYCLLPTKAFHHGLHQQVKAHCVKPGVGGEVGGGPESTQKGRRQQLVGYHLLPKKSRLQKDRKKGAS